MGKLIDLTGQRFGRLTVIERVQSKKYKNQTKTMWLCKCVSAIAEIQLSFLLET